MIQARSHHQIRAAQEQHKLYRPLISQMPTQTQDELIRKVGTKGQNQRSPRPVPSKKDEPSVATPRPEWRVVERCVSFLATDRRSSWSACLSSSRASISATAGSSLCFRAHAASNDRECSALAFEEGTTTTARAEGGGVH
jgi:hypothetical protein